MKKMMKLLMSLLVLFVFCTGFVYAGSDMKGHDMAKSGKIGDLIHESSVNGYMLSYYFMDLRDQKDNKQDMDTMNKPHHLMVYIMDKNHNPILKGKVGFMIKNDQGKAQKSMGMFMSKGFGTTADMKEKGVYTITTKAMLGDKKIMDRFDYEIK